MYGSYIRSLYVYFLSIYRGLFIYVVANGKTVSVPRQSRIRIRTPKRLRPAQCTFIEGNTLNNLKPNIVEMLSFTGRRLLLMEKKKNLNMTFVLCVSWK